MSTQPYRLHQYMLFYFFEYGCRKQRCVQTSQRSKMKTIESTSSDLRKIEIGDLRGRLVDMGIPRGDLEGLGRWDLVHLFRENANKARETGVGIEAIGK